MMGMKRGQVTVFAILGVSLLIILFLVLYMRSERMDIADPVVIPTELLPAHNYINFCRDQAVEEALFVLGRQGGYIDIPPLIRSNPAHHLSFGGGAEILPYWYYDRRLWIPTMTSMEQNLSATISTLFDTCVRDLELAIMVDVRFLADFPVTEVFINERDITVNIEYPLEVHALDSSSVTRLEQFHHTYSVRLAEMLDLAEYILWYENEYLFVENITMGLISLNDNIPLSGMELHCGDRVWPLASIRAELQDMLTATFSEIRVEGTDYFPYLADESLYDSYSSYRDDLWEAYGEVSLYDNFEETDGYERALRAAHNRVNSPSSPRPDDSYFYFNFRMPMLLEDAVFSDFSVDFMYDQMYGMDIRADPSSGGLLKSSHMRGMQRYLSFFCLNLYKFTYDITYPAVVVVRDPNAFAGRGFQLRFAFPVIIRENEGDRFLTHMRLPHERPRYDDFCLEGDGRRAIIRAYDASSPQDAASLADVNISLVCVDRKCPLGVTSAVGSDAFLRANITDTCANPFVVAEKDGYMMDVVLDNRRDLLHLEMVPLKNISVDFRKHQLNIADGSLSPAQQVTSGTVSVYLSTIVENIPYEQHYVFDTSQQHEIALPVTSAAYELQVMYLRDGDAYGGGYDDIWRVTVDEVRDASGVTFSFIEMLAFEFDEEDEEAAEMAASQLGMMDDLSRTIAPRFR